jgi:hypothetical protein
MRKRFVELTWVKRLERILLFRAGNYFYRNSRRFYTFDLVDLNEQVGVDVQLDSSARYGILLQGPLIPNLTVLISSYYQRIYPGVPIVLSTWVGSDLSEFDNVSSANFQIVLSHRPSYSGPSNVNLQIESTRRGIQALNDYNCTHILKTRTDVLLQSPTFISYLHFMLNKGSEESIVFSSFNSFLFRLFSPSDQIQFGKFKNIEAYWGVELVTKETKFNFPEEYLFRKYLSGFDYSVDNTLGCYWDALSKFAVIADHEQLGQIWNKGTYTSLSFRWRSKVFPNNMTQISSWMWESFRKNPTYLQKIAAKLS